MLPLKKPPSSTSDLRDESRNVCEESLLLREVSRLRCEEINETLDRRLTNTGTSKTKPQP
jgi:hypothetical protein